MRVLLLAAAVAATFAAAPANAVITSFTDRSVFDAAVGPLDIEQFTGTDHFPITSGVLNSETREAGLRAGEILGGVTYSTPVGTAPYFFNIDRGGGFVGGFLDSLSDDEQLLTITFDTAQAAFGFDTNEIMGAWTIAIFGGDDLLFTGSYAKAPSTLPIFFGYQSDTPNITRILIDGGGDSIFQFGLDNFTFNGVAVPEPATWAMMIGGVALVGGAARRRRAAALA